MSEQVVSEGVSKEIILKPADLARSYLGHEGAQLLRYTRNSECISEFLKNYDPSKNARLRPSYIEPGSMDANDWDIADLESQQWDENRDQIIEEDRQQLEELEEEKLRNGAEYMRVCRGDQALINKYSKLEIARRAELEEQKKKARK